MPRGLQVSCCTPLFFVCFLEIYLKKFKTSGYLPIAFLFCPFIIWYLFSFFPHFSTFQRGNKSLRGKSTCRKQVCSFIPKGAFLCSPSTQSHHNCRYTGWFSSVVSYIIPASVDLRSSTILNTDKLFLLLQFSSLLMLSQKHKTIRNPESWKPAISSTQHLQLCICRITMVFVHRQRAIKNYVQHGDLAGATESSDLVGRSLGSKCCQ
jgi:hypothetical protein